MNNEELKALLETTGLKVAYRAFDEKQAPPLPYICFYETDTDNFFADGKVYSQIRVMQIELYTRRKDSEIEDKVENALSSFCWNKTETYIETEKCYQISYELEV